MQIRTLPNSFNILEFLSLMLWIEITFIPTQNRTRRFDARLAYSFVHPKVTCVQTSLVPSPENGRKCARRLVLKLVGQVPVFLETGKN